MKMLDKHVIYINVLEKLLVSCLLRAKHINDSMFIDDLARWRQYSITLENSNKDTLNVYCVGTTGTVCIYMCVTSTVITCRFLFILE
jgi:hypothetical protein